MSISLPRYRTGGLPRLGRADRVLAIWLQELRTRAGWGTWLVVGLTYLIVVLVIVATAFFAGLTGGGSASLSGFAVIFQVPVWLFLVLIVTTAVGAGSLADDLGSRAITLFLSRPIRSVDYLGAKIGSVAFWIGVAAVGPGLVGVLLVATLGYAPASVSQAAALGFLEVGILVTLFSTAVAIFLSSLTTRALYAGAGIFGGILVSDILGAAIGGATGDSSIAYLSPGTDLTSVALWAFGVGTTPVDPGRAGVLLVTVSVVLLLLAGIRINETQVVAE